MEKLILLLNLYFLIYFPIKTNCENTLTIPFFSYLNSNRFNSSDQLLNILISPLITQISIGSENQKINISLNINSYFTYLIDSKICKNYFFTCFIKENSKTLINQTFINIFLYEDFYQALKGIDSIKINDNYFRNFNFLIVNQIDEKKEKQILNSGTIGFKIKNTIERQEINGITFLYQLKKRKIISNEIFHFDFTNKEKNEGNLILGKNNFDKEKYYILKTGIIELITNQIEWSFNFDNVYFNNSNLKNKNAIINNNIEFIIGTYDYRKKIEQEFFKPEKNCFFNIINTTFSTFHYFYCDKSVDIKKFKQLIFHLKEIQFNFTFNPEDLFQEINGKNIFKIVFYPYYNLLWVFGRMFLKKYNLYFDREKKLIYIEKENYNKKFFFHSFIFWIIFFLILFILILGFYIFFYLKKYPRKLRANELEDEYSYLPNKRIN